MTPLRKLLEEQMPEINLTKKDLSKGYSECCAKNWNNARAELLDIVDRVEIDEEMLHQIIVDTIYDPNESYKNYTINNELPNIEIILAKAIAKELPNLIKEVE